VRAPPPGRVRHCGQIATERAARAEDSPHRERAGRIAAFEHREGFAVKWRRRNRIADTGRDVDEPRGIGTTRAGSNPIALCSVARYSRTVVGAGPTRGRRPTRQLSTSSRATIAVTRSSMCKGWMRCRPPAGNGISGKLASVSNSSALAPPRPYTSDGCTMTDDSGNDNRNSSARRLLV
jgi:hypothetical protein